MTRRLRPRHPLRAAAFLAILAAWPVFGYASEFTIARLKYRGGGDWYSDPTSLPNLLAQVETRLGTAASREETKIAVMDEALFGYPFAYMTGHGNVDLSDEEAARMRLYLTSGGFLWADDCYGMDQSFRKAVRKIFPDAELAEVPFGHEIYRIVYGFPGGLPKIHEHDGGPPHGYGIIYEDRLVLFYAFNTDIGDGLEDADVHRDPPEKREAAMKMAVNIVAYALTH
jgi:hypothetical protein